MFYHLPIWLLPVKTLTHTLLLIIEKMHISRRKIIRSLGLVAGATAVALVPGLSALAQLQQQASENNGLGEKADANAVLIGVGSRGWAFGEFARTNPETLRIVAIGEPRAERRLQARKAWGLGGENCLPDAVALFEKMPAAQVAIITAAGSYVEHCAKALVAGYHVWVDKPASLAASEVLAINDLAQQHNRTLLYCYIHNGKLNFMDHRHFE